MERLTLDRTIQIDDFTLIPVVRDISSTASGKTGGFAFFMRRPEAVVVIAPGGARCLDIEGEEVSLDEYLEKVPDLKNYI